MWINGAAIFVGIKIEGLTTYIYLCILTREGRCYCEGNGKKII